jgi:predicted MFS family arabinose efflux permease
LDTSRLFAPLASHDYRRLWIAQFVSVIGDKVHQIAMSLLVYEVTGSIMHVGLMLAVTTLPAVLFGVVAGAYVDRWDRRSTMLVADLARALVVLSIPWLVHLGMPFFYLAAFTVASISLLFEPARLSLIPALVAPDQLMAANSLDNVTTSVSELMGLVFGAGLVAWLGTTKAFYFDGFTFVVSALFVAMVRYRGTAMAAGETAESLREQVEDGFRHIWGRPVLRDLLVVYTLAAAGIAASITAVNGLAFERFQNAVLGGRAVSLAILDGAITVGLLLGSASVGQSSTVNAGRKFLWSLTVFGVVFVMVAFTKNVFGAMALLLVGGAANMWFYVPGATIIQTSSARHLLGRVFATKNAVSRLATVLGFLIAGFLAERVGLTWTVLGIGGAVVLVALYGWLRPALREA